MCLLPLAGVAQPLQQRVGHVALAAGTAAALAGPQLQLWRFVALPLPHVVGQVEGREAGKQAVAVDWLRLGKRAALFSPIFHHWGAWPCWCPAHPPTCEEGEEEAAWLAWAEDMARG